MKISKINHALTHFLLSFALVFIVGNERNYIATMFWITVSFILLLRLVYVVATEWND